ncbi:MAG: zinc-ribbon domain-containing protein [Lactobacillus kefiranofaciens]|nr:zinc ribbon domain-containing protein [Lactobacillus kefiranofaciens subsp. kefiranofaciens]
MEEFKMKTCPNCGSKMEPSVNFCTNCGADLRNVPLDSEEHSVQASEPKMTRVGNRKETSEPKEGFSSF